MDCYKEEGITVRTLEVEESPCKLQFNVISHGVARYNSALVYGNDLLISCTAFLKLIEVETGRELFRKQVGNSQITQLYSNKDMIAVLNFEGLVTFLSKKDLNVELGQLRTAGKELRHNCMTDRYFATSSELITGGDDAMLEVFCLESCLKGDKKPIFTARGHFYYPEVHYNALTYIHYHDPNPKGQKRSDTVMEKKLPISNKIMVLRDFKPYHEQNIPHQSEIICVARNQEWLYYLHNDKFITVYNIDTKYLIEWDCKPKCKSVLMCVEKHGKGIVYPSANGVMTYMEVKDGKIIAEEINVKSPAVNGNFCIKITSDGDIFGFNENGLYKYSKKFQKTFDLQLFQITNCGLTASADGNYLSVGDFAGNVYIYPANSLTYNFKPLFQACVFMPIRALAWIDSTNSVAIGTTQGYLYTWNFYTEDPVQVFVFPYSINAMKVAHGYVMVGTAHGDICLFNEKDFSKELEHKAHVPIKYECPIKRELFGSLANYAEIWSLTANPKEYPDLMVASSSYDQTKKIFKIDKSKQALYEIAHLKGHYLATTSIDWKVMRKDVGYVFVSCSDDKKIIFRHPRHNFRVFLEAETTTVREWHTLTYLALEYGGSRVAIGSQNGYLFIFDIATQKFDYGEKVHLGGIYGLVWIKDKIITCSSDLAINLITVPPASPSPHI